jgi:hypothetical protein
MSWQASDLRLHVWGPSPSSGDGRIALPLILLRAQSQACGTPGFTRKRSAKSSAQHKRRLCCLCSWRMRRPPGAIPQEIADREAMSTKRSRSQELTEPVLF